MAFWIISSGFVDEIDGIRAIRVRSFWKKPGPQGAFAARAMEIAVEDGVWVFDEPLGKVTYFCTVAGTSSDLTSSSHTFLPDSKILGKRTVLLKPVSRASLVAKEKSEPLSSGYSIFLSSGRAKALPFCAGPLPKTHVTFLASQTPAKSAG